MSDLLPNDGFILDKPVERKEKESIEQAEAREDVKILDYLLTGVDELIDQADRLSAITMTPESSEESLRVQMIAARLRVQDLTSLKNWLTERVKQAKAVGNE